MKIYTKTGDSGESGLANGQRAAKDGVRLVAIGDTDELNSVIGVVRAEGAGKFDQWLEKIQNELFVVGAMLANAEISSPNLQPINEQNILFLENTIDLLSADLQPLTNFILPAGSRLTAALHQCRSVCRRAERAVVALAHAEKIDDNILKYLNRLSDLFFTAARAANQQAGLPDVFWKK